MTKFFNHLRTFLKPPVFAGEEEKTSDAKLLHQIIMASWSLPVLAILGGYLNPSMGGSLTPTGIVLAVALTLIMVLNRAGKAQLGSTILVGMVLLAMTYLNYSSAGEPRASLLLSVIIIMMGGLLLGTRGAIIVSILLVAQHLIIVLLYARGIIAPQNTPAGPALNAFLVTVGYLLIGFMLRLAIARIQLAVSQLQSNNLELQQLSGFLEQRVAERTKALATVAEISIAASTVLDTDELLQQAVDLSKERFNFYHAHIYLLNEAGDTLVLSSGAGEVGRQMVAEGRSISLDREQSLVARAAREKKGVTVNDVTTAPDFLPNPLLPDTHSEMAVPMMVGDQVIGVFDVQSEVVGRFTDADIAVQTTLASQIAAAVQNARLYTQAEITKHEAQSLVDYAAEGIVVLDLESGLFTESNENAQKIYGLSHDELLKVGPAQMSPAKQPDGRDSTEKAMEMINIAMQQGANTFEWTHVNALGVEFPCEIRLVRLPGEHPRLRVSITDITERKRLQELIVQRAYQQETINTITQKIQSATTVESALQVAARELGHLFGKKPVAVALDVDVLTVGETKSQL
jgi:PAS domain S-box-containing protein